MAAYRTGYGVGNYNVRVFGLDGEITDGISLVETSSAVVVNAETVKDASASSIASSSLSADGLYVVDAVASADSVSTAQSVGEVIYLGSAVSTASVTNASASIQFLTNAEASANVQSSVSSDAVRVRFGYPNVSGSTTVSADGFGTFTGNADIIGQSVVSSGCERIKLAEGVVSSTSVIFTIGREKWEPIAPATNTWTNVA